MFSQKYSKIIISIAFFIVLDLILFGLNYYSTSQFEIDTKNINRAGELRMLSQQLTKSLLTLQSETKIGAPTQSSLSELQDSSAFFDQNLALLQTHFAPESSASSENAIASNLKKITKEWASWTNSLNDLKTESLPQAELIELASTKLNTKNVYLLALSDDLIKSISLKAKAQNNSIELVLLCVLLLAVLNFIYIVFIFIKELERRDKEVEATDIQKNRILSAVNEGLLLIKPDGKIAKEMSNSIHRHFGKTVTANTAFISLFDGHLSEKSKGNLLNYIQLSLDSNTNLNTLKQLHPLKEIKLLMNGHSKYLSFDFAPIIEQNRVAELLVTVTDVSEINRIKSQLNAST
jgi:hypothetical protein